LAIEKINVPDLGDASEVEVIELLVSVGDKVEENDSLLVLESDKAAMEIPAPMAGTVKAISVNLGDQVKTGDDMMSLEVDSSSQDNAADAKTSEKKDEGQSAEKGQEKDQEKDSDNADAGEDNTASSADDQARKDDSRQSGKSGGGRSAGGSATVEVPDLGTDDEVEVIEIHVNKGDSVAVDDSLITLESDKAAMEVPATSAGQVEELLIAIGDKVKTGSAILKMSGVQEVQAGESGDDAESERKSDTDKAAAENDKERAQPGKSQDEAAAESGNKEPQAKAPSAAAAGSKVYAGPAVRKLARELGVDLLQVTGTGAKSRIVKEDVHEFVKSRLGGTATPSGAPISAVPDIDFSQFGEIAEVERSKLEKITAVNMHRNWTSIPHVAQFNEADVTELEDFREGLKSEAEKRGSKLTFMPFLLKACAKALAENPKFNVSLHSSGEYLIQKKYFHIGMAVATPAGLLVPVIRDVDRKSLWELADEVIELSNKARERKLKPEEMQGACFTISSLGPIGGTGFIPIINAPEVAILGVGKTQIKPVYLNGEFKPRKMLPLTLSYDHKAVNGVDGGLFAEYLAGALADIRRLLL